MARIVYPSDFAGQQQLLQSLAAKHSADGANSVLAGYLNQENVDLTAALAAAQTAKTHEESRKANNNVARNARQLRDIHFEPVLNFTRQAFQFLKKFYGSNSSALREWGAPIAGKGRIAYPTDFSKLQDIWNLLFTRLQQEPQDSVFIKFMAEQGAVAEELMTHAETASNANKQMETADRAAEEQQKERDRKWEPVWKAVKGMGAYLKAFYPTNAKKLGLWGFVVDDTPQQPRDRQSTLKPGETKISNGIYIGSAFTNTGKTDLHVYRGKTTTGTPHIIKPGEQLGMLKGYSVITVVNPNSLALGKYSLKIIK